MAEAAVSYVAERLLDLFQRKYVFLKNVQQQVEGVQNELVRMKCFLKDADMKQLEEEEAAALIRNWVSEIRAVAYHAEDVIEIFVLQVESQEHQSFFCKYALYPQKLYWLNRVGKDIDSIQNRILDISNSRERYGIRQVISGEGSVSTGTPRELRRSSPLVANKDVVGLEKHVKSVVEILLHEDKKLHVASIVGMGGIGKTTLAKQVYNQPQIRDRFEIRAWVYVSQEYKSTKIIKELILQLAKPEEDKVKIVQTMDGLPEAGLEEMLHRRLQENCYLVVLDDIWSTQAWDLLARSFPDNDKSSRLLLTTRIKEVALHADALTIPYDLKVLGEEESWELFLKKTFLTAECPQELVDVGKEIVGKCDGLPLAITVIGGLLAGKKKQKGEWQRVQRNLSSQLVGNQTYGVSTILALSYHDLPPHLKCCFLFLSLFRKDTDISVQQLMHIWIAHGLIHQTGDQQTLEDIAEDYLDELISRNMVQVSLVRADDRVRSCRLHDLLRDFCIMKAKEEIFLGVHENVDNQSISLPPESQRHHVLYGPLKRYRYLKNSKSYIRSIMFFDSSRLPESQRHRVLYNPLKRYASLENSKSYIRSLLSVDSSSSKLANLDFISTSSSFKLVKVLYIDSPDLKVISDSIGKLFYLKYLGIGWKTRVKKLPHSICRLKNLETIDMPMSRYYSVQVPNVLWKLENLRHLLGYINTHPSSSLLKIDLLSNLQTLGSIPVRHWMHSDQNLTRMTNLRKVGLLIDVNIDMSKLSDSLAGFENLQSLCLEVEADNNLTISMAEGCLSKLSHIVKLKLKGRLAPMATHPRVFPPNISQLTLVNSEIDPCSMLVLEKLSNLSVLKLIQPFDDRRTSSSVTLSSENGFQGLKFLRLDEVKYMEEMKVGKGAMAGLKCLQIFKCSALTSLPQELISLTSLEKLEIRGMPEPFIADLQKSQHVPNIVVGPPKARIEYEEDELELVAFLRIVSAREEAVKALFREAGRLPMRTNDHTD